MRTNHRWELDPASSEDYAERVREYDAYRAGGRFRQWLAERVTPRRGNDERPPAAGAAGPGPR